MSLIGILLTPARRTWYSQANGIDMCVWGTRYWCSSRSGPFLGEGQIRPRCCISGVQGMAHQGRWISAGQFSLCGVEIFVWEQLPVLDTCLLLSCKL